MLISPALPSSPTFLLPSVHFSPLPTFIIGTLQPSLNSVPMSQADHSAGHSGADWTSSPRSYLLSLDSEEYPICAAVAYLEQPENVHLPGFLHEKLVPKTDTVTVKDDTILADSDLDIACYNTKCKSDSESLADLGSFSFSRTSEQRTSGQIIFELRQGSDGHFTDVPPAIPLDEAETSLQEFLDSAPTYEIEDELFYYPPYGAPRWQVHVSDERPRSPSPDPYFTPVLAVHSSTFCTSDEECARGRHIVHHCPSN